jgi:hypothetical protein
MRACTTSTRAPAHSLASVPVISFRQTIYRLASGLESYRYSISEVYSGFQLRVLYVIRIRSAAVTKTIEQPSPSELLSSSPDSSLLSAVYQDESHAQPQCASHVYGIGQLPVLEEYQTLCSPAENHSTRYPSLATFLRGASRGQSLSHPIKIALDMERT